MLISDWSADGCSSDLPEQPPVYPELTVDEYLRFCAGLHGVAEKDIADALTSAKRDCGLGDVGTRLVGNLSKGYQQRVGIAQAILHRPPVDDRLHETDRTAENTQELQSLMRIPYDDSWLKKTNT